MPDSTADLVVSIVSYNTRADLANCLKSVYDAGIKRPFEVIVVDNGSNDGSQHMVREEYSQAILIETGENLGYGRANNRALLNRPGRYYLILNSDIVLEEGSVDRLIEELERRPDPGAAMGALVNPDGSFQTTWAAGELTVATILWEQSFLSRLFPRSRVFGGYFRTDWDHASACDLAQACGAFLLVRAELYNRLGGFDPEYFMYCEDTDLSRRIRDAGFKIAYVPEARAVHGHGKSSVGALRPKMIFEHNRSRYMYLYKFAGPGAARGARAIMIGGALARVAIWTLAGIFRPSARERVRAFAYVLRETARMKAAG